MADVGGWMPNSVYYTTPGYQTGPDSPIYRFTRAVQRGMKWLHEHAADDCGDLLAREWPGLPTEVLIKAVEEIRQSGVWRSVEIDREGFADWMQILKDEHLTDRVITYEELVDPEPARFAISTTD